MEGGINESEWIHFVVSLLNHDIGYVRGICKADRAGNYATNGEKEITTPKPGATDASLTPYHVDRAQLYIRERYQNDAFFDLDLLCANIERTRFPVPSAEDSQANDDMPGLLRAADLIGQLADPHYFRKISALFAEFSETGAAEAMGYATAADLQSGYPSFFWNVVSPYIEEGVRYLRRTQEGQAWVANLYANVFTEEHEAPSYGPERRTVKSEEAPARRRYDSDDAKAVQAQ